MSNEKTNVSIKILKEESKRKVTNLIQERLGIQIISENGSFEIIGDMENPTISAITHSIIENGITARLDINVQEVEEKLSDTKENDKKTEEKISEVKKDSGEKEVVTKDIKEPMKTEQVKAEPIKVEAVKVELIKAEPNKDRPIKVESKEVTKGGELSEDKKKILKFLEVNPGARTSEIAKEISKPAGDIQWILRALVSKGKIEKVSRGVWRIKSVGDNQSTTDAEKEETDQMNIVEKGPPIDEKDISEKILKCMQRGWRVTSEELAEKFKISKDIVEKVLIELQEKDKRIIKSGNEYYIPLSPFKFFDDETYKDLLDYIMCGREFSEDVLMRKFPNKKNEISELMIKLQPKYIKPKMDSLDNRYIVNTKASILYFVKNHPHCTKKKIILCLSMFNINQAEIQLEIKNAIIRGELRFDEKNQTYIALKM